MQRIGPLKYGSSCQNRTSIHLPFTKFSHAVNHFFPWMCDFLRAQNVPACNLLEEINVKKAFLALALAIALAGGIGADDDHDEKQDADRFEFKPGSLVVTRSKYVGTASSITVGETLPPGCVPLTVTLPILGSTKTTTVAVTC